MSSRYSDVLTSLAADVLACLTSHVLCGLTSNVLTSLATDVLSSLDCLAASDIGGSGGSLLGIDCLGGVGLFNFEGLIGVVNDLSE